MIVDLEKIKERWRNYDRPAANAVSKEAANDALQYMGNYDVPAMIAELEQWRKTTHGARLAELATETVETLSQVLDRAKGLTAYCEGMAKMGSGTKDGVRSIVNALTPALERADALLLQLKTVQNDTA